MQQLLRPLAVLISLCCAGTAPLGDGADHHRQSLPRSRRRTRSRRASARSNLSTVLPNQNALAELDEDRLEFAQAFEAFVNTMQGVNAAAIRKGFSRHRREGQ